MTPAATSPAPTNPTPHAAPRWLAGRSNTALVLCAVIGLAVFMLLARLAGVPGELHYQGSLLMQSTPLLAILITAVGLVGTSLLLMVLQNSHDVFDPLFGAAVGLVALSWRGGTMTSLLQYSGSSVFLVLIVETALLAVGLYGCYVLLVRLKPPRVDPRLQTETDWNANFLATAICGVVMAIVVGLLASTDAKKQVLAAVAIGAFAGAAAAYWFLENDCPLCYAAAPSAVAVVGYALAYLFPGVYHVGRTTQPLAYALPLDYASVGTAAALLGYWAAQRWKAESE